MNGMEDILEDLWAIELYYYSDTNQFVDCDGFEVNAYQLLPPWVMELFFHHEEYMSFLLEDGMYVEMFHDKDINNY